jgi:hypothetical protein
VQGLHEIFDRRGFSGTWRADHNHM